jgi:hypothetical protein
MQSSRIFGLAMCLVKAGLTGISGAATSFSTAVAITYSSAGKALSRAAIAGGVTPTVDFVTGLAITLLANQGTVVVWCLDAAGTVRCVRGSLERMQDGVFLTGYPNFPMIPLDKLTPFAYSVHKADANTVGTFTFGVSNWNATGLTHAVTDVITLPSRPQPA